MSDEPSMPDMPDMPAAPAAHGAGSDPPDKPQTTDKSQKPGLFGRIRRGRGQPGEQPLGDAAAPGEEPVAPLGEAAAAREQRQDKEERGAETSRLPLWTDTHCHLQYADGRVALAAAIDRAVQAGVRRMVCVGTDADSSRTALEIAVEHSQAGVLTADIFAAAGVHPHDAKGGLEDLLLFLADLERDHAKMARLVAIGECGLDFYYDHSPRDLQREVFAAQIDLARRYDRALVIHTRDAFDATLEVLAERGVPERTIFHCFTGGPAEAERCLEIGAYLSFSGIVTFASAEDVRASAKLCPLDKLLVETDSPYLTPVPNRGKSNEPAYVSLVGQAVAGARGIPPAELAEATTANAVAAFRLPVG